MYLPVYTKREEPDLPAKPYTVDSRYLEFQGTLWNSSRYPYFDISDLQNWGKISWLTTFNKYMCNWTLEVRDILKILWKRSNFSSFPQYFLHVRFSCLGRDQIFTSSLPRVQLKFTFNILLKMLFFNKLKKKEEETACILLWFLSKY